MPLASSKTLEKKVLCWTYVLQCADGCYYVGFSRYLHHRLKQHFAGFGAYFTRRHKPRRVLEIRPARSEDDEFSLWLQLARKYGSSFVGGYSPRVCSLVGRKWPRGLYITRSAKPLINTKLFPIGITATASHAAGGRAG